MHAPQIGFHQRIRHDGCFVSGHAHLLEGGGTESA
jgi:hypothetical protein